MLKILNNKLMKNNDTYKYPFLSSLLNFLTIRIPNKYQIFGLRGSKVVLYTKTSYA